MHPRRRLHRDIQQAIIDVIDQPQFSAALPPVSDETWLKIVHNSPTARAENDRLEFFGDALMYATIGQELYMQIPDGSPGLYTAIRAALHSNATFARLAEKLDILGVDAQVLRALTALDFGEGTSAAPHKPRPKIKATADLFETVIGAYYMDAGFERLCEWVRELYGPLISASKQIYLRSKILKKTENYSVLYGHFSRIRQKSCIGHSPARRSPLKRKLPSSTTKRKSLRLKDALRLPNGVSVYPTKRRKPILEARIKSPRTSAPAFIDLTLEDCNDETIATNGNF